MAQGPRHSALPTAAALAVLLLTAPRPHAALASLAGAASSPDPTAPLVAAVSLLAWGVAGWLALTVAVVLLSRVPGLLGRTGRALAGRVAPATVRRAVEAALGLTVVVGVLAPTTVLAAPAPRPAATTPAGASGEAWDLDWPGSPAAPAPEPDGPPTASSAPTRAPSPAGSLRPAAPLSTRPPAVTPATPPPAALRRAPVPPAAVQPSPVPAAGAVVVRAGDSLWSLAEASLRSTGTPRPTDRQVAQAWPRWWAANRAAIGDDPDLLLPGTVLRPPPASAP